MNPQRVLVLGASGMLGNTLFRYLATRSEHPTVGAVRSGAPPTTFSVELNSRVVTGMDALDDAALIALLARTRPDVVVNCVGVVKQKEAAKDPVGAIRGNALLPHRLASVCELAGARLVHISTDCVFDGARGMYTEDDVPNATDLYGRSKLLGEVTGRTNAITLRTSIIGHELGSRTGLLEWFLGERGPVKGFVAAYFSGLTTLELSRVIVEHVIPARDLCGLYHVSAERVSKHDLLKLVASTYGVGTEIVPDESLVIDRSLDSSRFRAVTGYSPPPWGELVASMHAFG